MIAKNLLFYLLITFIFFGSLPCLAKAENPKIDSSAGDLQKIVTIGEDFRKTMSDNYVEALKKFVSPEIVSWFSRINNKWWKDVPFEMVWRRILIDSQLLVVDTKNTTLLIYYSVWPDVYFITEWKILEGGPEIIDADIVSGDFLRLAKTKKIQDTPLWLRSNKYLLYSLEDSVVFSLKQADKLFYGKKFTDWRKFSELTGNNHRLKTSQEIARTNILSNLANVFQFQTLDKKEFICMRHAVYKLLAKLYMGGIKKYISSCDFKINKDVEQYLYDIEEFSLDNGNIVAHVENQDDALIFISFHEIPQILLSVRIDKSNERCHVNDIEIANYAGAYINEK